MRGVLVFPFPRFALAGWRGVPNPNSPIRCTTHHVSPPAYLTVDSLHGSLYTYMGSAWRTPPRPSGSSNKPQNGAGAACDGATATPSTAALAAPSNSSRRGTESAASPRAGPAGSLPAIRAALCVPVARAAWRRTVGRHMTGEALGPSGRRRALPRIMLPCMLPDQRAVANPRSVGNQFDQLGTRWQYRQLSLSKGLESRQLESRSKEVCKDWILKCLQGGGVHPLLACGWA